MRLIVPALLLSAGPFALGQSMLSAPQTPGPIPCNSTSQFTSPSTGPDVVSPAISPQLANRPNLNLKNLTLQQVKPAVPAQLFTRGPNPLRFLALNQPAPQVAPKALPHLKSEPIPTIFPDAHFENIPTNWPGLKFLLIDQPPAASAATDGKTK
jgi:hypothetical protein